MTGKGLSATSMYRLEQYFLYTSEPLCLDLCLAQTILRAQFSISLFSTSPKPVLSIWSLRGSITKQILRQMTLMECSWIILGSKQASSSRKYAWLQTSEELFLKISWSRLLAVGMLRFPSSFMTTSASYLMYSLAEILFLTMGNRNCRDGGYISSYFMAKQALTMMRQSLGIPSSSGFDSDCTYLMYISKARKRVLWRSFRTQCMRLNTINNLFRVISVSSFKGSLKVLLSDSC